MSEELPAFLKPVTEEDHKRGINLNWCVGCTGEDCPGCGNGLVLNCAELAELSMAHAQQYIEELTKQRDELLAIFKEVKAIANKKTLNIFGNIQQIQEMLAAIDKSEVTNVHD
jgi:hypothetical protein